MIIPIPNLSGEGICRFRNTQHFFTRWCPPVIYIYICLLRNTVKYNYLDMSPVNHLEIGVITNFANVNGGPILVFVVVAAVVMSLSS